MLVLAAALGVVLFMLLSDVSDKYPFCYVRVATLCILCLIIIIVMSGPGESGRVLPPVTGRSRVRVAVSSHCTGEVKACH